jgi:glycosyltransferase involved in cell wall biosynthesis
MALIAMAVYDTEENGRSEYTERTLLGLTYINNIDWNKHRLFIVNNNSCKKTYDFLMKWKEESDYFANITIIHLPENIGTAKAINTAWKHRKPGEHLVKMDNDVLVFNYKWVDVMEEVLNIGDRLTPQIGILGLKRKDLIESPYRTDGYQSQLMQIPHNTGERWHTVEIVNHCMGTCQMYHHKLIDKIGGLEQLGGIYGLDDTIASAKSQIAGFCNAFLNHIEIDHIDTGENTEYLKFKADYVSTKFDELHQLIDDYKTGKRDLFTTIN